MNSYSSYINKRYEFKYLLTNQQAFIVEEHIRRIGLVPDSFSRGGGYIVNSLYFDTLQLDDYRDKDASLLRRKKLRARIYDEVWGNELRQVWMEIKRKWNMNISKDRFVVPGNIWNDFYTQNDVRILLRAMKLNKRCDENAVHKFAYWFASHGYVPHVVVRYTRMAYLYRFLSLVRITFDRGIVATFSQDCATMSRAISVAPDMTVMEVKFNGKMPWWFTDMLTRFNLSRTDFSKYRNSVAVLRGKLRIPVAK